MREREPWVSERSKPLASVSVPHSLHQRSIHFDSGGLTQQFHCQHEPAEILFPNQNSCYPLQGSGFDPDSIPAFDEWVWLYSGASINHLPNVVNLL